jgi:hypothetical protein
MNTIYTLGNATTGLLFTGGVGYYFIGIADQDLSAGQTPVTVWVEGVFELTASSAWTTAYIGDAIMPDSGKVVDNTRVGLVSGNACIGSYIPAGSGERSGRSVLVKINPGVWRWMTYSQTSSLSSGAQALAFPRIS